MGPALLGSVESGIIFALMAMGVYLTFRILNFPDLTVDGSFTTGGSVAAVMIVGGYPPIMATFVAMLAGLFFGSLTGILHTKGKINALLSGILSMIALYSINLRIMGKANIGLLGEETVMSQMGAFTSAFAQAFSQYSTLIFMAVFVVVIKLVVDWFLDTEVGLALRATGDNPRMIRSFSANTDNTIIIGLALSNGLVALSGALMAQYQGFSDVSMGIGMIIIGLASVIIGEAIFGNRSIKRATLAVIGGAIIYRLVVAIALRVGLSPSDMKLMTALIVIVALITPKIISSMKEKKKKADRRKQITESRNPAQ
ncbi:ABC transporter permease [Ammoniphilus sp. CFH 90114]|uniref:ABC transporter permease n=1 Tax=Ammoniphilus sp. CFH 90114 TaxID=2493665 RepID=UPI00100DD2AC|nr:ABC transporter permease [Ammoniphilus sp. CFH 90114]RXT13584.1 ABC transporter permease [Ammoniphilus sp. CFH 90114]